MSRPELDADRAWLARLLGLRDANHGVYRTTDHMRRAFWAWLRVRHGESERARNVRRALARHGADPDAAALRGRVITRVSGPSVRRDRVVPKGGPGNLWRTFPPADRGDA